MESQASIATLVQTVVERRRLPGSHLTGKGENLSSKRILAHIVSRDGKKGKKEKRSTGVTASSRGHGRRRESPTSSSRDRAKAETEE